ncbi:MAG: hypothetical protein LBR64_05510 [Dysgonamonadaceae bacterium]|nr:hypothetical protein [Dysgonamonadaceae bacterium]
MKVFSLVVNPFERVAGAKSLIIGLAVMVAAGFVGTFSATYFDGVLDAHVGASSNFLHSFVCLAIDWAALAVVFGISAVIFARNSRLIDLFGTFALAQTPRLLMAFCGFLLPQSIVELNKAAETEPLESVIASAQTIMSQPGVLAALTLFAALSIVLIAWLVALYYNAFRISTNLKQPKIVIIFILGLLVAEVVSNIAIGMVL